MSNFLMYEGGAFLALGICISMLMFMYCVRSFDQVLRRKFVASFVVMALALTINIAKDFLKTMPGYTNLWNVLQAFKFLLEGFMEYEVLCIFDGNASSKKKAVYQAPLVLTSLFLVSAQIRDLMMPTLSMQFDRSIYVLVVYIECAVYAFMLFLITAGKWLNGRRKDAFIICIVAAELFASIVLEAYNIFHNAILPVSTVAVVFLYMYMFAERYNVDTVTKCYKRRCFYSDAIKYSHKNMAVISMDLNELKHINDNFGHKAGDMALLSFANVCRESKLNKFILYRTGGDEFMMLGVNASYEEAEALISIIKDKLSDTPYSSSFGLQMYKPGDDFDEVVLKADKEMYLDKNDYRMNHTKRMRSREDEMLRSIAGDYNIEKIATE